MDKLIEKHQFIFVIISVVNGYNTRQKQGQSTQNLNNKPLYFSIIQFADKPRRIII